MAFPESRRRTTRRTPSGHGSPTASASAHPAAIGRTELMRRLLADGIATRRGVMAIHEERAYAGTATQPLSHTEAAAADTLMLPLFPGLTEDAAGLRRRSPGGARAAARSLRPPTLPASGPGSARAGSCAAQRHWLAGEAPAGWVAPAGRSASPPRRSGLGAPDLARCGTSAPAAGPGDAAQSKEPEAPARVNRARRATEANRRHRGSSRPGGRGAMPVRATGG